MFAISVSFLLGILLCLQLPDLPPPLIFVLLPAVLWLLTRGCYLRLFAMVLSGFLWTVFSAHQAERDRLDPALEGKTLSLCGTVSSLPARQAHRSRFDFTVKSARLHDRHLTAFPQTVRLNWYNPTRQLLAGQHLCLSARLKRPYGFMNPGGFDYERWLYQRDIRALGYVVARQPVTVQSDTSVYNYHGLREYIRQHLLGQAASPLILALVLGDRSQMQAADWQIVQKTGTGHLLAISGLHIGLMAAFGFFLGRWLWSVTLLPVVGLPAQYVGALSALLMATVYAALAGFSLPTQRALLMIAAVLLALLGRRRISSMAVYGLALLAVLLHDPFAPLSYSFWLSFAAVLIILLITVQRANRPGYMQTWLKLQYCIGLGLLPVLLVLFGQVPTLSIPANLLAIPWVSFITVPSAFLATVFSLLDLPIAEYFFTLCEASITAFWLVMRWLGGLPFAQLQLPYLPLYIKLCTLMAVVVLLAPRGLFPGFLCVFLLLPLALYRPVRLASDAMVLTVFDVGQGLSVLLQTRSHTLLYDTGPAFSSGFNTGQAVVLPYLHHHGIRHLDVIIQSHADLDHSGGLQDILAAVSVGRIYASVPAAIPAADAAYCQAGQQWQWHGITLSLLHPGQADRFTGNNASCVLAISNSEIRILLPGDIEKAAERALLAAGDDQLDADILLVPHHGSATSSSPAFIRATRPVFAVFPVGYRNRFHLPKQAIIQRYREAGATLLYSYVSGALTFTIAGPTIVWSEHRQIHRRFWHTDALAEGREP